VREVLAVVQNEQQALRPDVLAEQLGRRYIGSFPNLKRRGDRPRDEARVPDRRQIHEPYATEEPIEDFARGSHGEARLSHPARSRHRHEPGSIEQLANFLDLSLAPDEARELFGQVRRRVCLGSRVDLACHQHALAGQIPHLARGRLGSARRHVELKGLSVVHGDGGLERFGKRSRRREPIGAVFCHRPRDRPPERLGKLRNALVGRYGRPGRMQETQFLPAVSLVGRVSADHLVDHHAEAVNVRPPVDLASAVALGLAPLFGRHIARRPEHRTSARYESGIAIHIPEQLCHAEVE
jgi:hypothetical protein